MDIHCAAWSPQCLGGGFVGAAGDERLDERSGKREERWFDDEREHEQLIDIKGKADGSDGADEPLCAGEADG